MNKTLKTYSEIESYLGRLAELLNKLQQIDDAKALKKLQQKYQGLITDRMKENEIQKLQYFHDQSIGVEYFIPGISNAK